MVVETTSGLSFVGASSHGGQIPDQPYLDAYAVSGFCVEFFGSFLIANVNDYKNIISKADSDTDGWQIRFYDGASTPNRFLVFKMNGTQIINYSLDNIKSGAHMAFAYDGTTMRYFIDGI